MLNIHAHLSSEERRHAMSDDEIANRMELTIQTFRNKCRSELMMLCRDLSSPQVDQCEESILAHFGDTGLSDAVTDITHSIRCQTEDVLGERRHTVRIQPIQNAAE